MAQTSRTPAVARAPRPWLSRESGECAYPVEGAGLRLQACCNPCGGATYCPPHAAAMRGPPALPIEELEREIFRLLDRDS
jgi:hypothetical protein